MISKATVILGASDNPDRYSYKATVKLRQNGHPVSPVGIREGTIEGESILTGKPELKNIHTVTLYLGAARQAEWQTYIYSLNPERIIFNPGAENEEFLREASGKGIECLNACTLVMLSLGNY